MAARASVVPEDLAAFVESAKREGVADADLVGLLKQHGWSERRAYAALSGYYAGRLGTIPERGGAAESARDAFLYLLAFATLSFWTVALVWLANVLADRAFPSALDAAYAVTTFRQEVAGQLASLIIAFPIFIAVSAFIVRETRRRPESVESGVRKWLTYIALVITAVIMLGDAVWFLTQFLLGGLTTRFVVKAVTVFVVAGGVLWYYLGTVSAEQRPRSRDAVFAWTASAVVALAIVLGFTGIGPPRYNRSVSYDRQRVRALQSLASDVNRVYARSKHLPETLGAAASAEPWTQTDPVTHVPFGYKRIGADRYELCAVFDTDNVSQASTSFWRHPAGPTCFTLAATQEIGSD